MPGLVLDELAKEPVAIRAWHRQLDFSE